jgi:two-component system sporulation sensor kinase A
MTTTGEQEVQGGQVKQEGHEQEDYRSLVQQASEGIITSDLKGTITSINPAALALSGLKRDEVIGKNISQLKALNPRDIPRILRVYNSAVTNGGKLAPTQISIRHEDGTQGWIEVRPNFIMQNGRISGLQSIIIDITERRKNEKKLRQYAGNLERIVENRTRKTRFLSDVASSIEQAVVVTDNEGRITYVNHAFEDMFGYKPKEILGHDTSILGYIEPDQGRHNEVLHALKSRRYWSGERLYNRKNATAFPASAFISTLRDKSGKAIGRLGLITDITEKRNLEDRLHRSEERLRRIFDNAPVAMILTDANGRYVEVNDAQCRLSQTSREELLKQNYLNQLDLSLQPSFKTALQGRVTEEEGWYTTTSSSLTYWVRTIFAPVFDSKEKVNGVIILSEDKTEKKKLEEQLFEQSRLAFIGATAAMVGHDLRNPLQAIVNTLYLLKRKTSTAIPGQADRQDVEKITEALEQQVDYMNKIVSDLQDYARPVKLELTEISVQDLIDESLMTVAIPSTVEVSKTYDPNLPKLSIDRTHMKRVFINLITNAIQAMPEGGKLTIKSFKAERVALISIRDTGSGIPRENMDRLFQPLFTTKAKGQGLGLAVCNRLVGTHGGEITVESEPDKGSVFTISLPLKTEVT